MSILFTANTQFVVRAREADVIQRAKGLRLQAERRLGEILRDMPKNPGALMRGSVVTEVNHGDSPTLAEIGIDKRTSSRAQKLAALPETKFAAVADARHPAKPGFFLTKLLTKAGNRMPETKTG